MDKGYLKQALLKYLEYMAKGDEKEALTMEKVLFTVLGADSGELEQIEKARRAKNGGYLSYFYASKTAVPVVGKPMQVRYSSGNAQTTPATQTPTKQGK